MPREGPRLQKRPVSHTKGQTLFRLRDDRPARRHNLWARKKTMSACDARCPHRCWRELDGPGKESSSLRRTAEISGVPQSIREKQPCDAVTTVALIHLQDALGVQFRTYHHIVMQMDAAFGDAGAPGRVQPKRSIIFACGGRL